MFLKSDMKVAKAFLCLESPLKFSLFASFSLQETHCVKIQWRNTLDQLFPSILLLVQGAARSWRQRSLWCKINSCPWPSEAARLEARGCGVATQVEDCDLCISLKLGWVMAFPSLLFQACGCALACPQCLDLWGQAVWRERELSLLEPAFRAALLSSCLHSTADKLFSPCWYYINPADQCPYLRAVLCRGWDHGADPATCTSAGTQLDLPGGDTARTSIVGSSWNIPAKILNYSWIS